MPGWDSRHRPVANEPWVWVLYHQQLLGSVAEFAHLEIHALHQPFTHRFSPLQYCQHSLGLYTYFLLFQAVLDLMLPRP